MPPKSNTPLSATDISSPPSSSVGTSDSSSSDLRMFSQTPPLLLPSPELGHIMRISELRSYSNIYWSVHHRDQQKYLFSMEKVFPLFVAQHFRLILKFLYRNYDKAIRNNLFKINFRAAYESLNHYSEKILAIENQITYLHHHLWDVNDNTLYSYNRIEHDTANNQMSDCVRAKKVLMVPEVFFKLFNPDLQNLFNLNLILKNERGERILYEKFINTRQTDPADLFDLLCIYYPKDNDSAKKSFMRFLDYDFKPVDPKLSRKSR